MLKSTASAGIRVDLGVAMKTCPDSDLPFISVVLQGGESCLAQGPGQCFDGAWNFQNLRITLSNPATTLRQSARLVLCLRWVACVARTMVVHAALSIKRL